MGAGLGLQVGVTPTPLCKPCGLCPPHACSVSTWWQNISSSVLGLRCCNLFPQPNWYDLLLLNLLCLVSTGERPTQGWAVAPGLHGAAGVGGGAGLGQEWYQKSTSISGGRSEPWSRKVVRRSGSRSRETLLESLPCRVVAV